MTPEEEVSRSIEVGTAFEALQGMMGFQLLLKDLQAWVDDALNDLEWAVEPDPKLVIRWQERLKLLKRVHTTLNSAIELKKELSDE